MLSSNDKRYLAKYHDQRLKTAIEDFYEYIDPASILEMMNTLLSGYTHQAKDDEFTIDEIADTVHVANRISHFLVHLRDLSEYCKEYNDKPDNKQNSCGTPDLKKGGESC